ncbi:MAG: response regulator [Caulobacteraceae bacterium]|nr:response regulator [Caulobacteraceae bacterium]
MSPATLLLVEDEELVIALLEEALGESGFEVVVARTGPEALAELETDAARFRAVLSDIRLPGSADGWAVGHRARELVADMPIVYMSGDSSHDWSSKGVPGSVMLTKPFAPAQIITAVTTLMNEVDTRRAVDR